ncbi:E3 ubiquitin-protein ligase MYLIP-like protein [Aphelenchoides avenae]|nr:E3 ubiquitin-protein ligase MYLIP-like protein [Aphelenchus avenae]
MEKAKRHTDTFNDICEYDVTNVLKDTGATLRDFEVRGTPDDDVASHRARLRATEYARIGLVEKGFGLVKRKITEFAELGYEPVCRPPGPVTIRLPSPFDDSELIASSAPLGSILKSASPEEEVTKRLRCVEDTLALARSKLIGKEETIDLKRKLSDKTMLLDEQAKEFQKTQKELQKTQKELAELSGSVQRAISGMDKMHPHPTTSQYERGALHRQLGQRVGAMLRQVESGAKNAKKLEATMQKLRVAEQDLQENRSRHANEMEAIKTEKAILAGEVDGLKAVIAVLEARVAELRESNAQLDHLERLVECVVCKDRYVDVVFHCGHTTCSDCGDRLELNKEPCPSCQQKLGYRKKLFLGS